MIKLAIIDVDGVLTHFRSAWRRLHAIFETDEWANASRVAFAKGLIDYDDWALIDAFMWLGMPLKWISAPITLRDGAIDLLRLLKRRGVVIVALSGGLNSVLKYIEDYVDYYISNEVVFDDNELLSGLIVNVDSKKFVDDIVALLNCSWKEVLAIGDSEMDIPMLEKAGYSIAYNPTSEKVARVAKFVVSSDTLYPVVRLVEALFT